MAVLAGAALIASLAIAHNKVFSNQVLLTKAVPKTPVIALYKGRVLSPKANCKRKREVQVWNATPNPDVRVARTHTFPNGYWKVKGARVPNGDQVYALIETKVIPSGPGHNHTCKPDQSPNVVFPHP